MRLEKLEISIQLYGSRVITDKVCEYRKSFKIFFQIFVIFDNCAISYNTINIDLSAVSDYDSSYIRR